MDTTDLRAAADILDRHPCEVYMLNEHCRQAAAEIERLTAAIRWALGEIPNAEGKWFGYQQSEIGRYWWRAPLRAAAGLVDEQKQET